MLQKVTNQSVHPTDDTYYQAAYLRNANIVLNASWDESTLSARCYLRMTLMAQRLQDCGNWISKQAKAVTEFICNLQKHVIADIRRDLSRSSGLFPVQSRASSDIGSGCSEALASAAGWESSWVRVQLDHMTVSPQNMRRFQKVSPNDRQAFKDTVDHLRKT